ncbi:MAG: hypothetical protein GMKNLPBB_00787 [Myxococcota bacterium]|nr:hypothetical protein [Myxococcota bacterium]
MSLPPDFADRVYAIVLQVPKGRVITYRQAATYAGSPRWARQAGQALRALGESPDARRRRAPWQRVINSQGRVSPGGDIHRPELQRALLEAEGVEFDDSGRVDLIRFGWTPSITTAVKSPKLSSTRKSRRTRQP